jgi:glycosyltransferase involved in cell wall biosynthesis
VLAPSYAAEDLSRYCKTVLSLPLSKDECSQFSSASARIPIAWYNRQRPGLEIARSYRPTIVYATGDFFPNVVVGSRIHRSMNVPFASVVHHINEPPFVRRNELARSVLSYAMQRFSLRLLRENADAIFLLNSGVRDGLARLHFRSERLHVVGAGIDIDRFPLVQEPPSSKNILWIHRLEPTKGIMDIGPILQLLPSNVTIDIVGSGPVNWRRRLERDLEQRMLRHRARIHGYVDDSSLRVLFERAAVFISCSYEEGWGISISEALACGIPCIAYDLPSTKEVFGEFVTRVPVGDTESFARTIQERLNGVDAIEHRVARRSFVEQYAYSSLANKEKLVMRSLLAKG